MLQIAGPALTMLVVSSVAFFLIEIFYQGPFVARVKWIFSLFCFAAVLISRISIVDGFSRASGFGLILGVATVIVTARLMQGNVFTLAAILALVWWIAGRLTWDCTFIDESRDATGQGMIDLAIERFQRFRKQQQTAESSSPTDNKPTKNKTNPNPNRSPWDIFVEVFWKRKQANTPGLWAFYFLLLGLPLFGIGQLFLGMTDDASHQAAAKHFFFYVTGLLGLLMLSSVLGLHRYLQKNQAAMPAHIAKRWIITGTILAIAITSICFMLPRPTAKYSVGNWLPKLTSQFTSPNSQSMGNDGQEKGKNNNQSGGPQARDQSQPKEEANTDPSNGGNQQKSDQGKSQDTQGGDQAGGKSEGKKGSGGKEKSQNSENSKQSQDKNGKKGQQQKQQGEQKAKNDSDQGDDSDEGKGKQNKESKSDAQNKKSASKKEDSQSKPGERNNQRQQNKKAQQKKGNKTGQSSQSPQSRNNSSGSQESPTSAIGNFLTRMIRLLVIMVAIAVGLWFVIKHRSQISPWIQSFLAELADFWARLFARKNKPTPENNPVLQDAKIPQKRLPGFNTYKNPFDNPNAKNWTPDKIVRYTFEALEAWARDKNIPRQPDETAIEFANSLGGTQPKLKKNAKVLAQLYSQLAYSGKNTASNAAATANHDSLSASTIRPLSEFWNQLTQSHSQI